MDKTNINEAVDAHLLDLQEATRRDDVFRDLNNIVDMLQALPVFPSLLWTWVFDVMRDIYENADTGYDEAVAEGVTLKQVFDKFWLDVDNMGLDMDSGGEIIEEVIRDWMRENNFLVALDEDGWLDDVSDLETV